jgi:hypothetical protein
MQAHERIPAEWRERNIAGRALLGLRSGARNGKIEPLFFRFARTAASLHNREKPESSGKGDGSVSIHG